MRYTANEIVEIFKDYPKDEVIYMWFKARDEFDDVVNISVEDWALIEDPKDWIYDYVNTVMYELVCEKVGE